MGHVVVMFPLCWFFKSVGHAERYHNSQPVSRLYRGVSMGLALGLSMGLSMGLAVWLSMGWLWGRILGWLWAFYTAAYGGDYGAV